MSISKLYHLDGVPDLDHAEAASIDYASIAFDVESKLISTMEAIGLISFEITEEANKKEVSTEKLESLGGIIYDLSELILFLNKISMVSRYSSGFKDGSGVTAK